VQAGSSSLREPAPTGLPGATERTVKVPFLQASEPSQVPGTMRRYVAVGSRSEPSTGASAVKQLTLPSSSPSRFRYALCSGGTVMLHACTSKCRAGGGYLSSSSSSRPSSMCSSLVAFVVSPPSSAFQSSCPVCVSENEGNVLYALLGIVGWGLL